MKAVIVTAFLVLTGCESQEAKLEKEAHALLDGESKDPLATQVRNIREAPTTPNAICGEANIKDKQGLYEGFKVFLALRDGSKPPFFSYPSAIRTIDDDKAVNECGTTAQKTKFNQQLRAEKNRFEIELSKLKRENDLNMLEAQLKLQEALAN